MIEFAIVILIIFYLLVGIGVAYLVNIRYKKEKSRYLYPGEAIVITIFWPTEILIFLFLGINILYKRMGFDGRTIK